MGPTWGPPRADKTQVGPMWATWNLLSGCSWRYGSHYVSICADNDLATRHHSARCWPSHISQNDFTWSVRVKSNELRYCLLCAVCFVVLTNELSYVFKTILLGAKICMVIFSYASSSPLRTYRACYLGSQYGDNYPRSGLILGLRPANERRRYFVTTSIIGWAQAWNQPC